MPKLEWDFYINGTDTNPYNKWGLEQNPFPQHGKYELQRHDLALQSLGGPPIRRAEDIRTRLRGLFTTQFIESVVARYQPGKIVHCTVTCEWKE